MAKKINDKVLMADARTNAADWQSAGAAVLGVLGIAWGYWWADAVAALFISLEILRSGYTEVRAALGDLVDRRPHQLDSMEPDPLPEKLTAFLREQDWVEDAVVRVREKGREFVAEAVVVPRGESPSLEEIERASRGAEDWTTGFEISP